ncbi:GNAT family N-acetyltransferase [Dactylosporangium sp. NPDC006015]|uniref:GNAT family N-acetyltransferase n=1 Tax=Dactylosporangium sp. NPDC006015 TaxID=3154576 RepID=UPI0033AC0A84
MLSDHLEVRPAIGRELDLVVAAFGDASFFAERMARQAEDNGVLLVAWLHGEVVGCVYVWFEDAEEAELRKHLPGVPLLNRLRVVERLRNQRIGTALVRAAEQVVRERGHAQLALGIGLDNAGAERLYLRLGFAEWPHGLVDTFYMVFKDEREVREPELCRILVKELNQEMPLKRD